MMMGMLTTAILASACAASSAASDTGATAETDHPHIVILFVDDMGYGDTGCYNAESKSRRRTSTVWLVPGCVSPTRTLPDRCAIRLGTGC
jgi:hypothetical protein